MWVANRRMRNDRFYAILNDHRSEETMTKHSVDRPKTVTGARLSRTMAVEIQGQPSKASLVLQRRQRKRLAEPRVKHFNRIARASA